MKVTVELTDNQAARWLDAWQHWIGHPRTTESSYDQAATALASGIVAARPKPLKVGDIVRLYASNPYEVAGFGVTNGKRWLVFLSSEQGHPCLASKVNEWMMADGSPIGWPE